MNVLGLPLSEVKRQLREQWSLTEADINIQMVQPPPYDQTKAAYPDEELRLIQVQMETSRKPGSEPVRLVVTPYPGDFPEQVHRSKKDD